MKIFSSMTDLIGHTPLLAYRTGGVTLLLKLEGANPGGSAKDRVAVSMIEEAERSGRLLPGGTVIEPTSGNTGIGIAAVAAARGYRAVIVMPDSMTRERQMLCRAFGAEVVLTPGALGMRGAIGKAEELQKSRPGAIIAGQFENPANPDAHYRTTGPEIYEDTEGKVDIFVCGVGTGGTLSGVGRYLRERKPSVRVVAVEPARSPVLSGGAPGPHGLQGIGAGFLPKTLDLSIPDEVVTVTEEEAYAAARELARRAGILCGISGGAALSAAQKIAEKNPDKTTVTLLPDTGERYLSTDLFGE